MIDCRQEVTPWQPLHSTRSSFPKRLKEAGILPAQAEAEAEALAEVLEVNFKEIATKDDLAILERRIDDKITMLEQRLVIKLGALMALSVGIVAALVKLL